MTSSNNSITPPRLEFDTVAVSNCRAPRRHRHRSSADRSGSLCDKTRSAGEGHDEALSRAGNVARAELLPPAERGERQYLWQMRSPERPRQEDCRMHRGIDVDLLSVDPSVGLQGA